MPTLIAPVLGDRVGIKDPIAGASSRAFSWRDLFTLSYFPPLRYRIVDRRLLRAVKDDASRINFQPKKRGRIESWYDLGAGRTDSSFLRSATGHSVGDIGISPICSEVAGQDASPLS